VREPLPPGREVSEAMHAHSIVLLVAESAVRRREHLDLMAALAESTQQFHQPRCNRIVRLTGERRNDVEDVHRQKYIRAPRRDNVLIGRAWIHRLAPRATPSISRDALRRLAHAGFRLALLIAAGFFLFRLARTYARDLSDTHFDIDALGIAAASAMWLASYAFLVRLWATSMTWWGARVRLTSALRVFAAANLARYIPGVVWQFASLAAMSASSGLSVMSVASAAVFQQIVLASIGLILGLAFAPYARLGAAWSMSVPAMLAIVIAALAGLVLILPKMTRSIDEWLSRRGTVTLTLPRVRRRDIAEYVILSGLGWVGYAVAFVIFANATFEPMPVNPVVLGASFVLSYVAGILAVFAPGGLVVREAALVALIGPVLGGEQALGLAIASRLWVTVIDAVLSALMLIRPTRSADTRLP
jgi:hypothetical protein